MSNQDFSRVSDKLKTSEDRLSLIGVIATWLAFADKLQGKSRWNISTIAWSGIVPRSPSLMAAASLLKGIDQESARQLMATLCDQH